MAQTGKHEGQTAGDGRAVAAVTDSDGSHATGLRRTRAYVGSERGSDGDLTVPRSPSRRIAMPSAPHWHVHLELRPEELVALHRAGYTSGALAWREGMDGWQPLRPDGTREEQSATGDAAAEASASGSDARNEAPARLEIEVDDSTTDADEHAPREESSVTENPRRAFLFTRGRRLTPPSMTLFPTPLVRQAAASGLSSTRAPVTRAISVASAPLPAFSDDPAAPPPGAYTPPAPSAFYGDAMGSMEGAAARALPPVPVPPPDGTGRFAARAPAYRPQAKPASLPPPTVLELPAPTRLVTPRSLWLGACALAALSACIGAVVSSVMWTMQADERVAAGAAASRASETPAATLPNRVALVDSVAPRKESVSVEELPLLAAGQRPEAVRTGTQASAANSVPEPRGASRREAARSPRATRRSGNAAALPEPTGVVERGPADMKGIVSAVGQATRAARSCGDSPQSGRVSLTFAPSGAVASVSLERAFGDRDVNSCVLRAMSRARVSAFVGAPVSVRKSLTW